jgi:hypothetical protein
MWPDSEKWPDIRPEPEPELSSGATLVLISFSEKLQRLLTSFLRKFGHTYAAILPVDEDLA